MVELTRPLCCRVLVVDDCRDTTTSMAILLRCWGCDAREANDGPTALKVADAFRPDVVLLDLGMPGMDGCQVARQLRRRADGRPLLVVSVSGYVDEPHVRLALEAGCDHHLAKPVELGELQRLLASCQPEQQEEPTVGEAAPRDE